MQHPATRRALLPAIAVAASLIVSLPSPAHASPVPTSVPTSVAAATDGIARQLAAALVQPRVRATVARAVASGPADLASIAVGASFDRASAATNQSLLALKGLPASTGSLLRVRLGDDGMRSALVAGAVPLVAAAPNDDAAKTVDAYEPGGGVVRLDTAVVPRRPVLVVEVDVAKALPVGLNLIRTALTTDRLAAVPVPTAAAAGGYWATKVDAVRLRDDEEPWIKGDAEIFSIVGGFGLDSQPKVDIVQMPYLNNDNTTYFPNQLLVHFRAYKYNLADVVMMEDDGDTNYLQLAQALVTALLTVVDQGAYIPLVNAILAAMPGSWWTDDPDYVDSWYTLSTASSGRLNGAAGNGWMDVSPYWVSEL